MIFLRNFSFLKFIKPQKRLLSTLEPVKLAYAVYQESACINTVPLVVCHGLFGSKSNWNSLCKAYQKRTSRKVIAIDARNHGDSPHSSEHSYEHLVVDLKHFLDELKLVKVVLLGHSMGGRTVLYFTLKYPHIVEKLIVADISPVTTSPNLRKTPELFDVLESVDLPKNVTLSAARSQIDSQMSKFVEDKGLRSFLLTNLIQKNDGNFDWRINIPILRSKFDHLARFPDAVDLKYDGPVLFVGGGLSDYIPKNDHGGIRKMFPRAQFHYIDGAGHWLHSEKPTEFLEVTVDFLNS